MINIVVGLLSLLLVLQTGCDDSESNEAPEYYPVTFAVFSDTHYYDPQLGTEGTSFENYLNLDRKMLKESQIHPLVFVSHFFAFRKWGD